MPRDAHWRVAVTLVYWRCSCGVEWRNHALKKKTDEDLVIEAGREFEAHQEDMK